MSPSEILWLIGSGLVNVLISMFFYFYLMGRKVQKWDSAVEGVKQLEMESKAYEGRISFLEGRLNGKTI